MFPMKVTTRSNSTVPANDGSLEIEETEGLIETSKQQQAASRSTCGLLWATAKNQACALLLLIVLSVLLLSDGIEIKFWEGKKGEKAADVTGKTTKNSEPVTYEPCPICASGSVKEPDGKVEMPFQEASATCAEMQQRGIEGKIPPEACGQLGKYTSHCGCDPAGDGDQPAPEPELEPAAEPAPETEEQPAPEGGEAQAPDAAQPLTSPYGADDFGPSRYHRIDQIVRPDPPIAPERNEQLSQEWGKWEFSDAKKGERPKDDYCAAYSHRDIPRDQFPAQAWQTDKEYLENFLDQGIQLVNRGLEAILAEYGRGKKDMPEAEFEERSKLFEVRKVDIDGGAGFTGKGYATSGAELSPRAWDGLVRRLLHALMTNDSFNVILGGHSAAAAHGNHFKQSYMMQFHKVTEPIFALLGMELTTRNLAQGGLGTMEHALGARSLYGSDVDIQVWDSGMTEGRDARAVDLYHRQSILGSDRAPLQLGDQGGHITVLHKEAEADVGMLGEGNQALLPVIGSKEEAQNVPYAARYMRCTQERTDDLCKPEKYHGICWIDGEWDEYKPIQQDGAPGSRVSWHPGNRVHQILGRSLAFTVLLALQEALTKWKDAPDYVLPDEDWHVTAYYENIQNKVRNLPDTIGACTKGDPVLPPRFCNTGIRYAATDFTPRPNPGKTSLQNIAVKASEGYGGSGFPHYSEPMVYTGPGPHNPVLDVPDGEIDVLAIISNGRDIPPYPIQPKPERQRRRLDGEAIETGLGWQPNDMRNGYCDGTWNMECNRPASEKCLLYGHADARGGWLFGGLSGWMVFDLKDVRDGIIALKVETWHSQAAITVAKDWTTVNGKVRRNLRSSTTEENQDYIDRERELKAPPPAYCPEFRFEYSVDGKVTSLDSDQFKAWMKPFQRVVEIGVVMDDPDFAGPRDIQLAIRQVGCDHSTLKAMKLTHVYWS